MNLLSEVGRSDWTGIEVKSNKGESALMTVTVRADEGALVKAIVNLEGQVRRFASNGIGPHTAALNARQSHKSVEVRDRRDFVDLRQR